MSCFFFSSFVLHDQVLSEAKSHQTEEQRIVLISGKKNECARKHTHTHLLYRHFFCNHFKYEEKTQEKMSVGSSGPKARFSSTFT